MFDYNKMANAWLDHVKDYREQNPDKSYTEALVEAKKTYKSSSSSSSSSGKSNKKVKKSKKSRKSKKSDKSNNNNNNNDDTNNNNNSMKENAKKERKQKKSNKKRKSVSNPWIEHVKQFRKENPNLSYTEALIEAKKTYKK